MAEQWPTELQDKFNTNNFQYAPDKPWIESDNEFGPKKRRSRYTKGFDIYNGSIDLKFSDWTTFNNFYKTTLSYGLKSFNFDNPLSQSSSEFEFVDAPAAAPIGSGGTNFRVTFQWREL
jgi:hypothetical protein